MSSQRSVRRLVSIAVLASGILTTAYMLTTTASSWTTATRSSVWSAIDNLARSVFLRRPDDDAGHAVERGPHGVTAEVRPQCPGRLNRDDDDDQLRDVCRPLLAGHESLLTPRPRWTAMSTAEYAQRTDNCRCFRSDLGYFDSPEDASDDERQLPLAFSLLTYENLEQASLYSRCDAVSTL